MQATPASWWVGVARSGAPVGITHPTIGTAAPIRSITPIGERTGTVPGTTRTRDAMELRDGSMGHTAALVSALATTRVPALILAAPLPMVHTERVARRRRITPALEHMQKLARAPASTAVGDRHTCNVAMIG